MNTMRILSAAAFATAIAVTSVSAQQPQTQRVRGVIEKVDGNTLLIKSPDGAPITLTLADNALVVGVVKATMADIKEGSYIGSGALPQPDGTQKAVGELLLADYTRRGFLDGIGIRLPTIVVRPGAPNKAASGFFSSIIREPLNGQDAVLPVSEDVRHWFASPRAAVGFLVHAAGLSREQIGARVNLTMPGLCCTVGEEIAALARVAGANVARRIRREPDETIAKIVAGWPQNFDADRAMALGFSAETSFDEIIRAHIEDELGGRIGGEENA